MKSFCTAMMVVSFGFLAVGIELNDDIYFYGGLIAFVCFIVAQRWSNARQQS